jgi:hypothetical protein
MDGVGLSPIITRLTRTYIEHVKNMKYQSPGECHSSSSGYSLTQALKMTEVEKVIVAASSSFGENESSKGKGAGTILFSELLDYAIWNHEGPGNDISASQIAGVVREIMRSAIKVVEHNLVDDSDLLLHVTEELNYFLQAQAKRLEILADQYYRQVLSSELFSSGTGDETRDLSRPRLSACLIVVSEAYYRLGLVALSSSRDSGELQGLWAGKAVFQGDRHSGANSNYDNFTLSATLKARQYFRCALSNAPPASFDLTKNILRCLALVTGPNEGEFGEGLTSSSLIHMSVGGSSRNMIRDELNGGKTHALFRAFDDESLQYDARINSLERSLLDFGRFLPMSWNISTLAICPTGELIVSSISTSLGSNKDKVTKFSNACIFPANESISDDVLWNGIHVDVLIPFDNIIEGNQKHLNGMTEEVQHDKYDAVLARRREWWKERHSFDEGLQKLLQHAERKYFSQDPIHHILIPDELFLCERLDRTIHDNDSSACSDLGCGNLNVESAKVVPFDMVTEKSKLMKLTVAVIKSKLVSCGVPENKIKKMTKSDLIHLLLTEMDMASRSISKENTSSINTAESNVVYNVRTCACDSDGDQARPEEPCLVLILDEHMQRFPLESMEMLSNIAITRVPCLSFVLAILVENEFIDSIATPPVVDPTKVKYVIDPESNLSDTASTLSSALDSMASKNHWKWEGVVGKLPPVEFVSEALQQENGLYLYCGHGGGEKVFSGSQLDALRKGRDDGIRGCRSSVILMGCSSGKLQSVNTPKVNPSAYGFTMHYEPEGIALSYLYAGAPCVIGNLWDVTDRDIDRYVVFLPCQKLNSFITVRSHQYMFLFI